MGGTPAWEGRPRGRDARVVGGRDACVKRSLSGRDALYKGGGGVSRPCALLRPCVKTGFA